MRRIALISLGIAAWMAPAAPAAQAASLSTLRPTEVTPTSAVLHGTIDTGGLGTQWRFVYGTTAGYGRSTPALTIPVGIGADYVVAFITGLRPNTTYHYRLLAVFGLIANYAEKASGKDVSFTTKPLGRLSMPAGRITAPGGRAMVPLRCRSAARCRGHLTLRAGPGSKTGVTCATSAFAIPAGQMRTIRAGLLPGCRYLLQRAARGRIATRLAVMSTSGQLGLTRVIALVR